MAGHTETHFSRLEMRGAQGTDPSQKPEKKGSGMSSKPIFSILLTGLVSFCIFQTSPDLPRLEGLNVSWAAGSPEKAGNQTANSSLEAGKKIKLDDSHYFIYGFEKKPKMGTNILKIQVFNSDAKRDTSYEITGSSGMPSMGSAHDTGEQPFKLNKQGDYLLPVDVVMPGEWEVELQFFKDKKPIFSGKVNFDV